MRKHPASIDPTKTCCEPEITDRGCENGSKIPLRMHPDVPEAACCGGPIAPTSLPHEQPGYEICHFVEDFMQTPAASVPRISTRLARIDRWGTFKVRSGIGRNNYSVAPGLYCIGHPGPEDPVLVTANYKLSFDTLRQDVCGLNAWLLVLDTRGVNVWCSAGKGTFSTAELVHRIKSVGLEKYVNHRRVILPSLSATGVAAHRVKRECGFKVVWGPVRSADIRQFLANGMKADIQMRRVTFRFAERLVLVPVELAALPKYLCGFALAIFILSGIDASFFSLQAALSRGIQLFSACLAGVMAGAIITPAMLPWIPMRAFSAKGALIGALAGIAVIALFRSSDGVFDAAAMLLFTVSISSFLAMNFTGATPFTSPSGVEKEMRRAIPLQVAALLLSVVSWVTAAFV